MINILSNTNAIILQGTLPAYCIPKVERLKTGEKLYEKQYLSPRPPPKISLKHDNNWTKGNDQLGSTVEQQPVGKLVQQSCGEAPRVKLSKPTQSKPKPICDRSGQPEDTERVFVDKGKTSRSQEIDDKRLHRRTWFFRYNGKPVKCEDNRVMKNHDRMVKQQEVGSLEHRDDANKFNLAIDEENIDFNISSVPNAMVKRSQLDSANREPPSTTSTSKWSSTTSSIQSLQRRIKRHAIKAAGNTELCEIVDVEPKSQCRTEHAWRIGTLASSTAPVDTLWKMIQQKTRSTSHPCWISSPSRTSTSGRAGHTVTDTGRKLVCKEYHTAKQLPKKCRKKHHENIHDRFIHDKFFRKTMIELGRSEEVILEMDRLASEYHSHIATQEEIDVYRGNWWIRSNLVDSDTMPTRHRPDFKKALSTLYRLKKTEDNEAQWKLVAQFLLMVAMANNLVASLWWDLTTKMNSTLIERGNLWQSVNQLFICGMNVTKNLVHNLLWLYR